MLCEVTKAMKDDSAKFKDFEVVVKFKQNNEPLPLHEPDDQVSVIDLQLLPQYDQGGGDVQHDVEEDQEHGVDRI